MNIVLFGPPGAGKGTQASSICSKFSIEHLSTGDLFRKAIKEETPMGKEVQSILKAGSLVPDETTIRVLETAILNSDCNGFLFDGYPRNVAQAQALDKLLEGQEMELNKAVFLEVKKELLMERLTGRRVCAQCGASYHIKMKPPQKDGICDVCGSTKIEQRPDDKADVIENRLNIYEKNTLPLKDYYMKAGKFVAVDGVGEPAVVFDRICSVMGV